MKEDENQDLQKFRFTTVALQHVNIENGTSIDKFLYFLSRMEKGKNLS